MLFRLILLFTVLPLVELSLLLRIGEWLGAGATIGLVVVTGVVGAALARREGVRTWARVRGEVAAGRMPGGELLHALLVFVAGLVLVTPGVLTDAAGLLLLWRPARAAVARRLQRRFAAGVGLQTLGVQTVGFGAADGGDRSYADEGAGARPDAAAGGGRIIEVETEGPTTGEA